MLFQIYSSRVIISIKLRIQAENYGQMFKGAVFFVQTDPIVKDATWLKKSSWHLIQIPCMLHGLNTSPNLFQNGNTL